MPRAWPGCVGAQCGEAAAGRGGHAGAPAGRPAEREPSATGGDGGLGAAAAAATPSRRSGTGHGLVVAIARRSRDGHGTVTGRSWDGRGGTMSKATACGVCEPSMYTCTPPAPPPQPHPSPFRPIHHSLTPSRQRPNPPSHALGRTLGPGPPPAPAAPWHPPTAPPRRGRPGPARCSGSQMVGGREGHALQAEPGSRRPSPDRSEGRGCPGKPLAAPGKPVHAL